MLDNPLQIPQIALIVFMLLFGFNLRKAIKGEPKAICFAILCLYISFLSIVVLKDFKTVEMTPQEHKAYKNFEKHNREDQKKTFTVDKKMYEAFEKEQVEKQQKEGQQ